MKICPHCGEKIQDLAKKCRFCGEWLEKKDQNLSEEISSAKTRKVAIENEVHHKHTKAKTDSVNDVLSLLSEEQKKFINSFSRGGFFAPTIMLFYTKQYGRAIGCLFLTLCGAILGLIPRLIVGGNFRRKAYLNNTYEDFDSFKDKIKDIETVCIALGIIGIGIIIMWISTW